MDDGGIAASLRAARARLGWSRETLAHHSGVSWSAIAQIESGRRKDVRLGSLSALADALGVTIDYLVRGGMPDRPGMLEHRALLYGSDRELVHVVAPFLAEGIERSDFVLVVATPGKARLLRDALGADARHIQFSDASHWYRSPAHALGGYRKLLEERCDRGSAWVRIAGQAAWAGRPAAERKPWRRYESVLNLALASAPATIVCLYDTRSAQGEALAEAQLAHPKIQSAGSVQPSPIYSDPAEMLLEME